MSFVDEYAGAKPIPKGRPVAPFKDFPEWKRREIAELVLADKPPARWLNLVGAQIESRAWYEWHWHRGINPNSGRGKLPTGMREAVIARDGFFCGLCGGEVETNDVHLDHILPKCRGGKDTLDNLQVTHSRCNLRKGGRVD